MIRITVDSFKYKDSLAVYELPKGSSVIDLKTEIEATESILIGSQTWMLLVYSHTEISGHQRLVYDNRDLQDNEELDSSLFEDPSNAIIYLLQARIYLHLKEQDTHSEETSDCDSKPQAVKIIKISVDLERPVRILSAYLTHWQPYGQIIDLSSTKLSISGPNKPLVISISDIDQSFSFYSVCNDDAITIVYTHDQSISFYDVFSQSRKKRKRPHNETINQSISISPHDDPFVYPRVRRKKCSFQFHKSPRAPTLVQAKHDWDGEIMHPTLKGLPLKCNTLFRIIERHDWGSQQPGWLYGTPIGRSKSDFPFWQPFLERQSEGYFPEVFVSYVGDNVGNGLETEDNMINIPPQLPPFRFPPADGMIFHMPISDNGHSFLKLTVNYELTSHPVDPTHVTISLLCTTHDIRRVSSVSVFITIPQSTVSNVQICENEAHRKEIQTDQEVTESWSNGKHFDGINIGAHGTSVGFQGGISQKRSIGNTEKGPKVSRRKVDTGILKEDTIFWNLKAPMTRLDEDGLNGEQFLTFVLKKKPVRFKYKCRVTHAVEDGVKRTTERISRDWSFLKLV